MVDISTVSIVIASAGVFAAAIYYISQIRHQTRVRQTDLVLRLLSPYFNLSSRELRELYVKVLACEYKDYNDFVEKYGAFYSEKPEPVAFYMLGAYVGSVGVLLHRRLVDIDLLADFLGESAILMWEKMKPVIEGVRKQYKTPRAFQWFEYLYNEMKKREQRDVKSG